ncbi:MAG: hypothetical protein QOK15_1451 [Nocardioidaceae bacterium]|jgi:uncharacterized membrane protein|nr:hypothetical protein [Nocardioidaceae bacterium]
MSQSSLTVWMFESPEGARSAVRSLEDVQKDDLLTILDYATVSWEQGKKKPTTEHGLPPATSNGALGGAFWGMLFGLIFFVPLLGAAVGAAKGALTGSMADVGIDDGFIKRVRQEVTPGTSALFLMSSVTVLDRVKDRFAAHDPSELICTNLSEEQEKALRQVFEEE